MEMKHEWILAFSFEPLKLKKKKNTEKGVEFGQKIVYHLNRKTMRHVRKPCK